MLAPKGRKFRKERKHNKGYICGNTKAGYELSHGTIGMAALEPCRVTSAQIEACRRVIVRHISRGSKKEGTVFIKIFPDRPITKKPAEVRMGGGKGSPEYWVTIVKPGRILFEILGAKEENAKKALSLAAYKLPIRTKIIREDNLVV